MYVDGCYDGAIYPPELCSTFNESSMYFSPKCNERTRRASPSMPNSFTGWGNVLKMFGSSEAQVKK